MGVRAIRAVGGDPAVRETKIALSPDYAGFPGAWRILQPDDVEVLVMGKGVEWETSNTATMPPRKASTKRSSFAATFLPSRPSWRTVRVG